MKIGTLLIAAGLGISLSLGAGSASAELPSYRVEMLPVPAEADGGGWAGGLNNVGDVVGSIGGSTLGTRAVQWSAVDHALTVLPLGKGQPANARADAINDAGTIVGEFDVFVAVTWYGTPLQWSSSANPSVVLPLTKPRRAASVAAINSDGFAVGQTWWPRPRALLWAPGGAVQEIGTLDPGRAAWSVALGINDAGMVAGTAGKSDGPRHAFVWTAADGMRRLASLPGNDATEAFAISSRGEVIGRALYSAQPWRFVRWSGTEASDLGPLTIGLDVSQAGISGINGAGLVIGYHLTPAGPHGYVMARDGTIADLADRIDAADPMKAAFTRGTFYAKAINDQGVIAGTLGLNPDTRPFLLVPK